MKQSEQLHIAACVLEITEEEAAKTSSIIPGTDILRCYVPERGGGSILVGSDGSALFAASCISPQEHLEEFLAGRRTSLEGFNI